MLTRHATTILKIKGPLIQLMRPEAAAIWQLKSSCPGFVMKKPRCAARIA